MNNARQLDKQLTPEQTILTKWNNAWQQPLFKQNLVIGLSIFTCLLGIFPIFYQFIETRIGFNQSDIFLDVISAYDVSLPIFFVTWLVAILGITRAIQEPSIFMNFMYGFIFVNLLRFVSILLIPSNPPAELIPISDPISNIFYGTHFITKDLFFSGHTALPFLLFLTLRKKSDKFLALISTAVMGFLVLVQHVHFTVDVLFAPAFAYLSYNLSCKICKSKFSLSYKKLLRTARV